MVKIRKYKPGEAITVAGITFESIEAIKECVEADVSSNNDMRPKSRIYMSKRSQFREAPGGWHVLLIYERYPCFDSEDYAYEDRYFNNFIFLRTEPTKEICYKYLHLKAKLNYNMANDSLPEDCVPIVYFDDMDTIFVADKE